MQSETTDSEIFPKTLVVKALGNIEQLKTFTKDLTKVYPRQSMTFSHIIKNRGNPGYHVFINIVLPSSKSKEEGR